MLGDGKLEKTNDKRKISDDPLEQLSYAGVRDSDTDLYRLRLFILSVDYSRGSNRAVDYWSVVLNCDRGSYLHAVRVDPRNFW